MDLLDNVTDAQREAITHVDGPLLVLAGAGSGKTLAITRRIAYLIESGVPASSILAITFTNKAAGEMRERVERLTQRPDVWVSTFHAFAARVLRRDIHRIGFTRDFSIYDTVDQADCIKEAMRALDIDTTQWRPAAVASRISHVKNLMTPAVELEEGDLFDRIVRQVHAKYVDLMRENNALDFDDLLLHVTTLFDEAPDVLAAYQQSLRYVLIDEYQDTNKPQYLMAKRLCETHRNICATGDPDQSIYGWRGADIDNILNFERDFPGARVVKLEENFRSTGKILEGASGVIAHNQRRKEKRLWTRNDVGEPIRVLHLRDDLREATTVTRVIRDELREGRSPDDVAIFFRTNALSRTLERCLIQESIPYTIVGTVEFFRRREIKDLLAYLRVRENPADAIGLERIVNVPRRAVGPKAVAALKRHARDHGIPLLDAIRDCDNVVGLPKQGLKGLRALRTILQEITEAPDSPVAPLLRTVLEATQYKAYLAQTDSGREEERLENVSELVAAAMEFDFRHPEGTLREFLEEVSLLSDIDHWDRDVPRVTLMTLHAAKGLEFPLVFIVGLEEGLLPHQRSIDACDVEEERRLFHVGMTRARERLIITTAMLRNRFGGAGPGLPSRFLDEIPPDATYVEGSESFGFDPELDPGYEPTSFRRRERDRGFDDFLDGDTRGDTNTTTDAETTPDYVDDSGGGSLRRRRAATTHSATDDSATDDSEASIASDGFEVGDVVQHEHFGIGTILEITGHSGQARVVIRFESGDERKLLLQYAKLCKLL